MSNSLAGETSPYLLQHADNPIHWQPWDDEVFTRAQSENKLIFLSVGYSTCHWCHVMAHESFEDDEVADLLNQHFICIKVDREERPDVDAVYMGYLQLTTGHGGWPMSVWLTPDAKPILGGTYFPKEDKEGRVGFINVCNQLVHLWEDDSERTIKGASAALVEMQRRASTWDSSSSEDVAVLLEKYVHQAESGFDHEWGGFGGSPKFPRPVVLDALYYCQRELQDIESKRKCTEMITYTLQKMAEGGMHDQLGGGFHRYSVDSKWHVPHFEKMLYDQAQLMMTYATVYGAESREVKNTFNYLVKTLLDSCGLYASGEDADSEDHLGEKKEGAYWCWTYDEIYQAVGNAEQAYILCLTYGVEHHGNVDPASDPHGDLRGVNVLFQGKSVAEVSEMLGKEESEIKDYLVEGNQRLLGYRSKRALPHKDEKLVAAWNGYLLKSLAWLARCNGGDEFKKAAVSLAEAIYKELWDGEVLYRTSRNGVKRVQGFAQDYAAVINGLLYLIGVDSSEKWLKWAVKLQEKLDQYFWDEGQQAYTLQLEVNDQKLLTLVEDYDGAEPSVMALCCENLSRLDLVMPGLNYGEKWQMVSQRLEPIVAQQVFASPAILKELAVHKAGRKLVKIGEGSKYSSAQIIAQVDPWDQLILTDGDEVIICEKGSCKNL